MQRGSVKAPRGVAVLQRGSAKEQNEPVAALDEPGKELAERGGRLDEPVGGLPGPVFVRSLKELTLLVSPMSPPLPVSCSSLLEKQSLSQDNSLPLLRASAWMMKVAWQSAEIASCLKVLK
jgi:hypothetical protein